VHYSWPSSLPSLLVHKRRRESWVIVLPSFCRSGKSRPRHKCALGTGSRRTMTRHELTDTGFAGRCMGNRPADEQPNSQKGRGGAPKRRDKSPGSMGGAAGCPFFITQAAGEPARLPGAAAGGCGIHCHGTPTAKKARIRSAPRTGTTRSENNAAARDDHVAESARNNDNNNATTQIAHNTNRPTRRELERGKGCERRPLQKRALGHNGKPSENKLNRTRTSV